MSEKPLIKSSSTYFEPEKMKVRNNKGVDMRRNEKVWAVGSVIEVDSQEGEALHKEGFQVVQEGEETETPEVKLELEKVGE